MKMKMPLCQNCGRELKLSISFTGCDWKSEAGEKSGYDYEVRLDCDFCGRVYTLGYVRNEKDFSPYKLVLT